MSSPTSNEPRLRVVEPRFILPFILVTSLFSLWGFANDITNPMVAAFKNILLISNFESSRWCSSPSMAVTVSWPSRPRC